MSTHYWGDENFDWKGLDNAVTYIDRVLRKWGRVNVMQTKEKFGQLRCYCSLGWKCLHDITHPGYQRYRYPKWLMKLDIYVFSKIVPLFNFAVVPYHKWIYRKVHADMVKKHPHLREEILVMADYPELLKGL